MYRKLRRDLENGRFAINSVLPPGHELCKEYGVSRPTYAKAVIRLTEEGRLKPRRGFGTVVLPPANTSRSSILSLMSSVRDKVLVQTQERALKSGLLLSTFFQSAHNWDPAMERRYLQCVSEQGSLALLAFCSPIKPLNDDLLQELVAKGTRVIHYEHFSVSAPRQEYLLPDFRRAGHMAAIRLLMSGCQHIKLGGNWTTNPVDYLLEQGVAQALEEHVGAYRPEETRHSRYTTEQRLAGLEKTFAENLPPNTGVIEMDVSSAANIAACARQAGRNDIRLVGLIDDAPGTREPGIDLLWLDRQSRIDRILANLAEPDADALHDYQKPVWLDS